MAAISAWISVQMMRTGLNLADALSRHVFSLRIQGLRSTQSDKRVARRFSLRSIGNFRKEFATHTPFPNIRRCKLSPQEFAQQFDEHLYGELETRMTLELFICWPVGRRNF